eukprot:184910_1
MSETLASIRKSKTKAKPDSKTVRHDSLLHCEDSAYMERSRSRRISSLVGNEQTKKKSDGRPSVAHEGRAASNIKKGRESRKDKRMFGGLRGGFLSKPHGKKNKQKKSNDKPKIAVVKKPVDDQTAYVLPEVQTAMKNSYQSAGDLVTPELIQKIADNPSLLRKIADPRLAQAMAEISKDPKAAKNKYRNDTEMLGFIREFMEFMGDHLSQIPSDRPQTTQNQDDAEPIISESREEMENFDGRSVPKSQLRKWMNDPELQRILNDPATSKILTELKRNPDSIKRHRNDPRIAKLLESGIIRV